MIIGIDASRALRAQRTGTERYSLEIIHHLLKLAGAARHQWRLYTEQPPETGLFPDRSVSSSDANVTTRVLGATSLWTHRQLAREIRRHPPDVLFVPAHVIPFQWPKKRLPPSVVTVHDLGHRHVGAAHTRVQRLYLELSTRWNVYTAKRVICVSRATAHDVAQFYGRPQSRLDVIHEAAEQATAPRESRIAATQRRYDLPLPYLYFIGTIQPRKNLVRLVEAYARFRQQSGLDWPLVLAGKPGWKLEPILETIQACALQGQVRLPGFIPDNDAADLLAGSHIFCFPSLFEGFGLPVLEAQQRGIPVMAANSSCLPEIGGEGAIYVDPLDIDAIADAMLVLSQDEPLRQRLIAAGYENVKRFSWDKAARATLAVLEQAASRQRS